MKTADLCQNWDLDKWLSYIEALHPEEIVLGLERVKAVARRAGLLAVDCPVVLVGGTNGKGSTVSTLATLLMAHNLRVGSYFSPHLLRFNERIAINGQCIEDAVLCRIFEKIESYRCDTPNNFLTFFEFTTLAALQFFKDAACDIIILEVGLGGRLDAVNIIEPTLSIITTLGLDHTDRLGDTIDKIAIEKAGILRKNKCALIGAQAQNQCLIAHAHKIKAILRQETKDFGWKLNASKKDNWYFNDKAIIKNIELSEKVNNLNIPSSSVSLALAAFYILASYYPKLIPHISITSHLNLEKAQLPGRFQAYGNTIFDVAHNPLGAQYLSEKLSNPTKPSNIRYIAVWSSFKDKELAPMVQALQATIDIWVIAPLEHPRAASTSMLKQALKVNGISETAIFSEESIQAAYQKACLLAGSSDIIVVFGSFVTVSQVMVHVNPNIIYQSGFYKKLESQIN